MGDRKMTVLRNSNAVNLTAKKGFPANYEAEVSQRLVDAANARDVKTALECIADPFVDVNFVGTVSLKSKKTEIVLRGELTHQVRVDHYEFRTDVTALFLAAHSGTLELVRKLISAGANVNQKVFRGYPTTAAVREGHTNILEILIGCGASQLACEEALLEASYLGWAPQAKMLMASDMIRSHVAVHALVSASSRGFADVVNSLIESGVDTNAIDRLLLQSSKPSLHSTVNCSALIAAIIGRHINVVKLLLQAGGSTDVKVNLGAWSWDPSTEAGEEFRVGAGLAEPYGAAWCAVEYFEASGSILRLLLQQGTPSSSVNDPHLGRTLIHHAILCNNAEAVDVLMNCGSDLETEGASVGGAIHLAARLGSAEILEKLVRQSGCSSAVNSVTTFGETAMMICARRKFEGGLRVLASAGADFGLVNPRGESAGSIADSVGWGAGFRGMVLSLVREGVRVRSSCKTVFSLLIFVTGERDIDAVKKVLQEESTDIDQQERDGLSAIMVAALNGDVASFELLLDAGANLNLRNKLGETLWRLCEESRNRDEFERLMLKRALEMRKNRTNFVISHFYALHHAARRGDLNYIREFLTAKDGYGYGYGYGDDANALDDEGSTPLMAAAREGHGKICEFLISVGAECRIKNLAGETALSLARSGGVVGNEAERVILDSLARGLVCGGARVEKHTRGGKGAPHGKVLGMVVGSGSGVVGVLRWGRSRKRNVVCKVAGVGPTERFRRARRRQSDVDEPGLFHVVTDRGREVHFVCDGGVEMAKLWVRGIRLVSRESYFGLKKAM